LYTSPKCTRQGTGITNHSAADELEGLRRSRLNLSERTRQEVLEFPRSTTGPWSRYVHNPNARGIGTVRYPRLVPKDVASAKNLQKKRTLTNLYNERPTWLDSTRVNQEPPQA